MSRTILSCLGLGLAAAAATGGSAILGAPAATVAATLALAAGSALGGVAGNFATELCKLLHRPVAERWLEGRSGIDENHHVASALRLAQIHALEVVLGHTTWPADPDPARHAEADRFNRALRRFLDAETATAQRAGFDSALADDEQALRQTVLSRLPEAFDESLANRRAAGDQTALRQSLVALRTTVEAAVLAEIRLRTDTPDGPLPTTFSRGFAGDGFPDSWFDLFIRDAAARLKDQPDFAVIWQAEQLALVKAITQAQDAVLARLEAKTDRVGEGVGRIETGVDLVRGELSQLRQSVERLTGDLSLSQAEKIALTADLAKVQQQYNGTVSLVTGFLETIVGRQVPSDQLSTMLFRVAADWKVAGDRIDALTASRNLSPRVAALKAQAQAAHGKGRPDAATAALAEIDRLKSAALDQLEAHGQEIQQEVRLRRISIADTRAAQAAVARSSLAYRDTATHYRAAAQVIAPVDAREEWRYLLHAASALHDLGREFGDNTALTEAIQLYCDNALPRAPRDQRPDDWATTQNNLGLALETLGERESETGRLEQAVSAYRAALEKWRRERVPLRWAATQNNLGIALGALGTREAGTARLEEAVLAYRAALQEQTRERVPLGWAATQNNLGTVLQTLGTRAGGTARLEEAVLAYRAALQERTRERIPLGWAATQNNLANTLATLGTRKDGTARLEEAVLAYRAALQERTRERVPLDWAMTQNNLANTLATLGTREGGTARLEEAVSAHRAALEEQTRERVPLDWAMTQNNLGNALVRLGARESGTTRLEEAVLAYRAALEERTRERVPLNWATTQNNLGAALQTLGGHESGTARLEEAVSAYHAALQEWTREQVPLNWAASLGNQGVALMHLADRTGDAAMAETALHQITEAHGVSREGGHAPNAAYFAAQIPEARAVLDRLRGA